MLRVVKALNNNVVVGRDEQSGREVIVVGRGIGFKPSTQPIGLNDPRIEKVFYFLEKGRQEQFLQLLKVVDDRIIGVAEEIIEMVARVTGQEVNEHLHISLPDHLAFAVQRVANGMELPNPFLPEIQTLYTAEFELAGRALALLQDRLGLQLPTEEQGYLALHIYAARQNRPASSVTRHTALIAEIVAQVKAALGVDLPEGQAAYVRLMVHLRHALESIETGHETVNPLLDRITAEFPEAYALAEKIAEHISQRLSKRVSPAEIGYLAIHLIKLMNMRPA